MIELIEIIEDLLTEFDEMGFMPTTTVPAPDAYAIEWKNKLTDALRKQIAEMLISETCELHIPMEVAYRVRTAHPIFKAIKAEAIKEFAERLKKKKCHYSETEYTFDFDGVTVEDIDNLVKEMTEEHYETQ